MFLLLYLCCPFPFFVCASFLETDFLTSPSQIHFPFTFISCLALLFSILELLYFHAWCFLLCLFFCLVFAWFSSHCCFHLSFHFWCFSCLFLLLLVLALLWMRVLWWFELMMKEENPQKEFPVVLVQFGVGLWENPFGSGCSASLRWSCGVRKSMELNNGTPFFFN